MTPSNFVARVGRLPSSAAVQAGVPSRDRYRRDRKRPWRMAADVTPDASFAKLVPLLIGAATALFAFSGNVRRWIVRHDDDAALHSARADRVGLVLLGPLAVYAGYFGAGVGIVLLAILSLGPRSDFRTVNALKNLLSGATGVVAMIIFIAKGMVAWPPTLALLVGALTGGYVGARIARVVPEPLVRWIVIVVGVTVTVVFMRRYWWPD
jgi:uncharacterized membrane protein YfcA